MKNKIKLFFLPIAVLFFGFLLTNHVQAEDPCASSLPAGSACITSTGAPGKCVDNFCNIVEGGGPTVVVPDELAGLPTNSDLVKGIATNVADWLLGIIGIIATIGFVISGFQYFLVASDEKMMEKAKKTMVASIIGLIVALSGFIAIKTIDVLLRAQL